MAIDYSKLSDEELAKIAGVELPSKSSQPDYSKMSDEELAQIAGVTLDKKPQGMAEKVLGAVDTIGKPVFDYSAGAWQGMAELPAGAYNLANRYLLGNKLPAANPQIDKLASNPNLAKAGEIGAMLATPIPGVGLLSGAIKGAGLVSKLARLGAHGAEGAGSGAALSALYGAANPNSNVSDDALTGAKFGGALGAASPVVGGLAQAFSKLYRGTRTPEQAQKIADIAGDLPIPAGAITNSPVLNTLYAAITHLPGSGVKDSRSNLIKTIDHDATDFLNARRGETTKASAGENLRSAIEQNYDYHSNIAKQKYEELAKAMDDANLSIPKDGEFLTAAKDILDKENQMRGFGIDKSLISALKNSVQDQSDKYSYTPAHFLRSRLLDKERQASKSNNLAESKIYSQLSNALENDIENSVKQAGIEDLYQKRLDANQYFKENVAPYRDKKISNLINGNLKETNISDSILDAKYKKIIDHLSPEQKKLFQYSHLSKGAEETAEGDILTLPSALSKYKSLTKTQRDLLFNPEEQQQFNKFSDINQMTAPIRSRVKTPLTGYALKDEAENASKIAASAALIKSGIPGAALLGGTIAGGNALRQLLESPGFRNSFIAKMGKTEQIPEKTNNLTNALIRMLAQQNSGGNQ